MTTPPELTIEEMEKHVHAMTMLMLNINRKEMINGARIYLETHHDKTFEEALAFAILSFAEGLIRYSDLIANYMVEYESEKI